jgi:hypothetical protein
MKPEVLPEEIDIPSHNGSVEHSAQTKHFPKKHVPLVSAQSSISMRYDPYKSGKATVIDSCCATRTYSHRPESRFVEETAAEKRDAPEKSTRQDNLYQDRDDSQYTRQPRRKTLVSSQNNPLPLPLAPARSSISIKGRPSRPDFVHVVDSFSPTDINQVSPLSDAVGSISSVVSVKGYAEYVDVGSIVVFPERGVKMRSKRRHPPLTSQNSLTSIQTAPSVIQRFAVNNFNTFRETKFRKHLNGCTTKRDRTSEKQYMLSGDENLPKSDSRFTTQTQSSYVQSNARNHAVQSQRSRYPQSDDCFSPASTPFRRQHICPADYVELGRSRVAKQVTETREHECFLEQNSVSPRQLRTLSDQSLRGVSTIASDFEVEVCAYKGTNKGNDDCDDVCSVTTFNSIRSKSLNGVKANKMLGRLVPKKIKEKISQHRSGAQSVFSLPERGLPLISEYTTVEHKHNQRMSTGPTIAFTSNVIENVTSELTDMNFSEDQSTTSISDNYAVKQSPALMKTARRRTAMRVARRKVAGKHTAATHDNLSVCSSNSTNETCQDVGDMLSPATSNPESFENRCGRIPNRNSEINSVATKASLFSRCKQKARKSLMAPQSTNIISSHVRKEECSSHSSSISPSKRVSTDVTAATEDKITTIYDRSASKKYPLSTRVKTDFSGENSFALELQPYPSGTEEQLISGYRRKIDNHVHLGDFTSPRLPTIRPAKALFGLSFGGEEEASFTGLDRHRSESKNAELTMLPSEDTGVVEDTLPDPSPEYLKSTLDDTAMNPFLASLNSLCAQYCITKT